MGVLSLQNGREGGGGTMGDDQKEPGLRVGGRWQEFTYLRYGSLIRKGGRLAIQVDWIDFLS